MIHLNKTIFLAFAVFLGGCASMEITSGRIGEMNGPSGDGEETQLIILRNATYVSSKVAYLIALDGMDIFAIRNAEYTKLDISTGPHKISVKCEFAGSWKGETIEFAASQVKPSVVFIHPTWACAGIKELTYEEVEEALPKAKYVSRETRSNVGN